MYSIQDMSGAAGVVGVDDQHAATLAVSDINKQHYLGATKLSITFGDTGSSPTTAAQLASKVASGHYAVVFGPPLSTTAVAVAPILTKADEPTIFTQAGSDGVLVSDYMFRMTPLQVSQYQLSLQWLGTKTKSVGVITSSDNPTAVALSNELKSSGAKYGYSVTREASVLQDQSDIAPSVTSVLSSHPGALALNISPGQDGSAITLARQAGFTGPILANETAGGGALAGAGASANGVVWTADWAAGEPGQTAMSAAFTKEYEAAYGSAPSDWSAESYDAVWYAARALKSANSISPAEVQAALVKEGTTAVTGVLGSRITVSDGQESATPVLVQWLDGKEQPLADQNP